MHSLVSSSGRRFVVPTLSVSAEGYGVMVAFAYVNAHEWID